VTERGLHGSLDPTARTAGAVDIAATAARQPAATYGQLPLSFERNVGQVDARVEYLPRGKGYTLFLTAGAKAVLSLGGDGADPDVPETTENNRGAVLKLRFVGAGQNTAGEGTSKLPGVVNYLVGSDRAAWRAGIPTFSKVQYPDLYPGIDVVFYGNQGDSSTAWS
jgi:hypothetical protein